MNLPKSKQEIIEEKQKIVLEFLLDLKKTKKYTTKELCEVIINGTDEISFNHLRYFVKKGLGYSMSEEKLDFLLQRKEEIENYINNTK